MSRWIVPVEKHLLANTRRLSPVKLAFHRCPPLQSVAAAPGGQDRSQMRVRKPRGSLSPSIPGRQPLTKSKSPLTRPAEGIANSPHRIPWQRDPKPHGEVLSPRTIAPVLRVIGDQGDQFFEIEFINRNSLAHSLKLLKIHVHNVFG
jgi:hypothetical protein